MHKLDLTDDLVRRLPFAAPGECMQFADATIDNMRIVVSATLKAFFYVPGVVPDGNVRWRLGRFPETGTGRARDLARRLNQIMARRGYDDPIEASPTFATVGEAYISWLPERPRNRSADADARFLRRYVLDPATNPWMDRPVAEVTDADVARLVLSLRDRPAPALARNCLVKLKAMFAWAMHFQRRRKFGLESNPIARLTAHDLGLRLRRRSRILRPLELRAYLAAGERLASASDRALTKGLLFTGLAASELTAMKWSELAPERGLWKRTDRKGRVVALPLSDAMLAVLKDLRGAPSSDGDGLVFGRRRSTRDLSRLRREIGRHMDQAIEETSRLPEPWRWMDLRRTVFAMLVAGGPDWPMASAAVGRGEPLVGEAESIPAALNRHADELDAIRRGDFPVGW